MDENKYKTSDGVAQQKTAIFLQMVYLFCETILGFPLMVIGAVALSEWGDSGRGSYIAMVVVGVVILCLLAYSIYVLYRMMKEYKSGQIKLNTAIYCAIALNGYGYSLIRESHGIISKHRQNKIARKQAKAQRPVKVQKPAKPKKGQK